MREGELPSPDAVRDAPTPDALLLLDARGRIVAGNQDAERLLGPGLEGSSCAERLAPRDPEGGELAGWPAASALRTVRGVPPTELDLVGARGRRVRVAATVRYFRGDRGQLLGAAVGLREVGRRRLGDPAARLVATVAHELRAPLTSVKGFVALLLHRWDRLSPEDRHQMLDQANTDADRLSRLIGELLDVSRIEAGRVSIRPLPLDLGSLVREVVERAARAFPGSSLVSELPAGLPAVRADPDKIAQVLTNLVENALKYGTGDVRVSGQDVGKEVAITVSDEGLIPADRLPKLFRADWHMEHHERPTGTGLGLYIARGLVEAHGGRITAASSPEHGTVFMFTLPVADAPVER